MIFLILLSIIFIYARFIEPKILIIRHEALQIHNQKKEGEAQNKKIKIAIFSDMHLGVFKNALPLNKIIEALNKENPDIVIIPGDFVYHIKKEKIKQTFKELEKIKAPVYAVTGNHDVGEPGENVAPILRKTLKDLKIHIIDDKIEKINIKGIDLTIIGFKDIWEKDIDLNLLNNLKKEDNVIVVSHNPDSVYEFPANSNIDLVICGHTHGGQIRLPFVYKLAIPTEHDFDRGFYKINNMNIYVTSGTGMVGLPLRFFIPPELIIMEVKF
jgi:hypothetical protein